MKLCLLTALALVFCIPTLESVAQTTADSRSVSPELASQTDKVFEKWAKRDSPGCSLGVYKDARIIYKHAYGMADLDHDVPNAPETVFHVASMSKQFTAAAILLLAQQGKLSLDDDVRKYLPELPDFGQTIRIQHLIHHTSGLRDQWDLLELAGWRYSLDLITDDDVMSVVTRQKDLNFKPGDKHVYCNTGYTLLGLIVKRVSGLSLREFTTKNIFEPLGMTHTHFRDDHREIIKHNARGYEQHGKDTPFLMSLTNFDTVGATSLHTTVEDLQLWDENFYHPRVGNPEFIRLMLEPGKLNSGEKLDYASGLVHGKYKGLPTVDHGGADAGYRSELTRFPDQHFSVAVLCNSADTAPWALAQQVADIFLAKQLTPDAASPPSSTAGAKLTPEQIARWNGLFWNREDDSFVKIFVKDGKLQMDRGGDTYVLKAADAETFHVADQPWGDSVEMRFSPAAGDLPMRFAESFAGGKPTTFESVAPFGPNLEQLQEYVGVYASEEIDPLYRISLQEGKLVLTRLKHKPDSLDAKIRDAFAGEVGTLRFSRDSNQHVAGFLLSTGRIRNFRFAKKSN